MKILSLNVQNFLRVEALEIIPSGNSVRITGKNEQGKSSTLRALDVALGGGTMPTDPVRRGANKGQIVVELGDGSTVEAIVTKTYVNRDDKPVLQTLTVTTPEGARWPKPQEFLDKLLGGLSLDPVKFLGMKPEDQAKAVRAFVPGFDFAAGEAENKKDYAARTEVNRDLARLEGEIAGIPALPEDAVTELVDTAALLDAVQKGSEANMAIERAATAIAEMERDHRRKLDACAEIETDIADLEGKLAELKDDLRNGQTAATQLATSIEEARALYEKLEPISVTALRTQLDTAEETNNVIRETKGHITRRARLEAELTETKAKAAALTKAMDDRKDAAKKAISEAKLPVEGLGFDDEGNVTLNGFAFENTAYSKRLMVAITIAAAQSPKLRLIKISEGDKLDDDSQALLAAFADEHDLQVWQETVQHGQPVGFVIEDGKLKEIAE